METHRSATRITVICVRLMPGSASMRVEPLPSVKNAVLRIIITITIIAKSMVYDTVFGRTRVSGTVEGCDRGYK